MEQRLDAFREELGPALRSVRTSQGKSLRQVAQDIGISPSLLSQVETNKTQPSVSTLYALVTHLGVSLDDLLSGSEVRSLAPLPAKTRAHQAEESGLAKLLSKDAETVVQKAENALVIEMDNGVRWEKLASRRGTSVDALLVTYQPGSSSSMEGKLMRHQGLEFGVILEGELTFQLEFDTHLLKPGDSISFDASRPHMFANNGDIQVRGVWYVLGWDEMVFHPTTMQATGYHQPSEEQSVKQGKPLSAVDILNAFNQRG